MAKYTQVNRWLRVHTPLGADKLLLTRFEGTERLSEAFCFRLELVAELDTSVEFDKILGQQICVEIAPPRRPTRYFSGLVVSFTQVRRDDTFQYFRAKVRPKFWRLSKRRQSRIFQQKTAPQAFETVLAGVEHQPQLTAQYLPHNFCVQYRESDFAFANRLMEEEGIYYYHEHTHDGHKLLLADASTQAKKLPGGATLRFDPARGGRRDDVRIGVWAKTQRVVATNYQLWDHQFQLPGQTLEASQTLTTTVQAGSVSHTLAAKGTETLGDFDYPGDYAHRFDGIDPAGAEQADDVQHVFTANARAARVRMERAASRALTIKGESNAPHLTPGYQFTLAGHYDGDGDYFLTGVTHRATQSFSRPGQEDEPPTYENSFECVPASLTWRPAAATRAPRIRGTQNAMVVGPAGERIFTDKYGRIKVQFLWDRQGKHDVHSSCWLRVQQYAAGNSWGQVHVPRVGQEVLVAFHEGDPDQPHVVGVNYNPQQMPPFALPSERTITGFKSHSKNGNANNFSGLLYNDADGQEYVQLHSERTMTHSAEHDFYANTGRQHHVNVGQIHSCRVGGLHTNHFLTSGAGGGSAADVDPPTSGAVIAAPGSGAGGDAAPPFAWTSDVWGDFGAVALNVFGLNAVNTAGLAATITIGCADNTVINPLGYLFGLRRGAIEGMSAANLLESVTPFSLAPAALSATMGWAQVVYGTNTAVNYGPQTIINKGTTWTIDATQFKSGVPNLFATLHALGCASLFFIQQLQPNWAGKVDFALLSMLPSMMLDCWTATAVLQQVEASAVKMVEEAVHDATAIIQRENDELAAKIVAAQREVQLAQDEVERANLEVFLEEGEPGEAAALNLQQLATQALTEKETELAELQAQQPQPTDPQAIKTRLTSNLELMLATKTKGAAITLATAGAIELAAIAAFLAVSIESGKGSGSGSGLLEEAITPDTFLHDSGNAYRVCVPAITLAATPNEEVEGAAIYLKAVGVPGEGGDIELSADNSTLITGGELASMLIETTAEEIGAISANAGPDGSIILQCGEEMEPAGITISAEEGIIANALEQISLRCIENLIEITPEGITLMAGESLIEITAEGITIEGPILTISGDGEISVDAGEMSVEAGSFNLESGDTNVDAGELNVTAGDANVEAGMVNIL